MYIRKSTHILIYQEKKCFSIPRNILILLNVQDLCKENNKTLLVDVKKDVDRKVTL